MVKIDNRIPQRGDIFRLSLNPRVGSEQSGYRPVIGDGFVLEHPAPPGTYICF